MDDHLLLELHPARTAGYTDVRLDADHHVTFQVSIVMIGELDGRIFVGIAAPMCDERVAEILKPVRKARTERLAELAERSARPELRNARRKEVACGSVERALLRGGCAVATEVGERHIDQKPILGDEIG